MRQHRRSGPLDAREGALMYLLRKYVRQAGAAPLPEPSQPSDPATLWAGDLRRSATLARDVLADGQNPTLPCFWPAMSVGVLAHHEAGKNPMSETIGIERLGRFLAGCVDQPSGGGSVKLTFAFPAIVHSSPKESGHGEARQRSEESQQGS